MRCSECGGSGKRKNPEWEREVERKAESEDYLDRASVEIIVSRNYKQFIECKKCNGGSQTPDQSDDNNLF